MADNVMKLGLVLSATDRMSRVVDQAVGKSMSKFNSFQQKANKIGSAMQKWGAGMMASGAAIEGGMFAATKAVAGEAKEISLAATKAGVGVETWQKLSFAAKKGGMEADMFGSSLAKLQKVQVAAAMGNKSAAQGFKMAGISIYDANGKLKSSEELIKNLADKFKKAPDGPKKTALAMMIFGKAGAAMIPMLNKGSKSIDEMGEQLDQMGVVLSAEQIEQYKKYNAQIGAMGLAAKGLRNTIANAALPVMTKWVTKIAEIDKKFIAWTRNHKTLVKSVLYGVAIFAALLTIFGSLAIVLGTVIKSVSIYTKAFKALRFALFTIRFHLWNVITTMKGWAIWSKISAGATNILTAAQKFLNAAFITSPIGWIVLGIMALVAAVVICWKKFAGFRAAIKTTWDVIKGFGSILKDYVIDRIKGIISGLGSMGKAISLLFHGKFSAAFQEAKSGVKALSGYDAAAKAFQRSKTLVKSVNNKYTEHLAVERAKDAIKQGSKDGVSKTFESFKTQKSTSNNNTTSVIKNSAPTTIHYNPTVHVGSASAADKDSFGKMLREHKRDLVQVLKEVNNNNVRVNFAQ